MASTNNIVKLADFPRARDRASVARQSMKAPDCSDQAYDFAAQQVRRASAVSVAGALAKLELAWALVEAVCGGDELTDDGYAELRLLLSSATATLASFTRNDAA